MSQNETCGARTKRRRAVFAAVGVGFAVVVLGGCAGSGGYARYGYGYTSHHRHAVYDGHYDGRGSTSYRHGHHHHGHRDSGSGRGGYRSGHGHGQRGGGTRHPAFDRPHGRGPW